MERDLLRDIYLARIDISASLASGMMAGDPKTAFEFPKASLEAYLQLTLPYLAKKDNIKKTLGSPKDLASLKKMLDEKTKLTNGRK